MANIEFKNFILEVVSNSKVLRKKLPLKEHLKLYQWVSVIKEEELIKLLEYRDPTKEKPIYEKILRIGFATACIVMPIPFIGELLFATAKYLEDGISYECIKDCKKHPDSSSFCYKVCNYEATKKVSKILENSFKKCKYEPIEKNRNKCFKKMTSLLIKWKQREVESKIKMDHTQNIINLRLRR